MSCNAPAVPPGKLGCEALLSVKYNAFGSWKNVSRWWSLMYLPLTLPIVLLRPWIYSRSPNVEFFSDLLNMSRLHSDNSWGGSGSQIIPQSTWPVRQDSPILMTISEFILLQQSDLTPPDSLISQLDPPLQYSSLSTLITFGCFAALLCWLPSSHLIPCVLLVGSPKTELYSYYLLKY